METRRNTAKKETRSALIRAALALFQEEGFDGPSLDAICARAGYTRGAFYVHFKDREDLVAAAMADTLERIVGRVIDSDSENEASLLRAVLTYIDSTLTPQATRARDDGPRFHQFLEACHRSPRVREVFQETIGKVVAPVGRLVESGQVQGGIRTDISSQDMAGVLILMAMGALVAVDVGLDMKLEETRNAALQLLQTP
ncbi:MAG: TetR/AcrR family transcriptional regulator [Myxococcota bacterium]|nr:TetR/AcrR family transcriptional regulator [Myxococcota bacterium]